MHAAPAKNRLESLDVLRGVAILGIFAVNIIAFGFPFYVLSNPSLTPAFTEPSGAFWWTISTGGFFQKFITIFSALFGAGIILMLGEEQQSPKTSIHRKRMIWLLVIGMIHAHLFWFGDILVPYAVAGFLVAGARVWKPRNLVLIGSLLIVINFLIFYLQDLAFNFMSPEEIEEMSAEMWAPPPEVLNAELEKYRGNFIERTPQALGNSVLFQLVQTLLFGMRTAGVMMIGMALYKTGFLTLRWRPSAYAIAGVLCTTIGGAGSFWGAHEHIRTNFEILDVFPGQAAVYWASLIQAFGYASLVMFFCSIDGLLKLLRAPFAAAGRMALSNYLASTIIGITIFFGPPGLGKIGTMNFPDLAKVVGGVWLFILIWSPIWLSLFRFGPAEWVWRSLTYGQFQPMLNSR